MITGKKNKHPRIELWVPILGSALSLVASLPVEECIKQLFVQKTALAVQSHDQGSPIALGVP